VYAAHADPLDPIRAALAAMANDPAQPPINGLAPDLIVADATGWVPATAVTSGDALDDLLSAARVHWDAPPHTAAALAWKFYTYWLALPAVVGFAACRRVPLPDPEDVLVRWSPHQPFLRIGLAGPEVAVLPADPVAAEAGSARVPVVADDAALLALLRKSIMDSHLEPLVGRIRERVHLGPHTLWGSLASGIAHGLSRASAVIPGPALDTANQVLQALGIDDLVELSTRPGAAGLNIQRHTCCLAFTLPEPKICQGCCVR
jgi:hypothetical protein